MTVKYKPVTKGSPVTMEQQALLLAQAAERVWRLWTNLPLEHELRQPDAEFAQSMKFLFMEMEHMDIFMGGVAQERGDFL